MWARLAVGLIGLYQRHLSPLFGRRCRFYPSCSAYAVEAIRKKGLARGLVKGLWRVLRCNPFGRGGYDPVDPEEATPEVGDSVQRQAGGEPGEKRPHCAP